MTATNTGRPGGRRKTLLAVILVLLIALLGGLLYVVVGTLAPSVVGVRTAGRGAGLTWIRSIYGYGSSPSQLLKGPTDVAIAPDGTIWATDPQRARIVGFNPDGSFRGLISVGPPSRATGHMLHPEGVATDSTGNVYVADFGNSAILVFTPQGKLIRQWSVPTPTEVTVSGGRVAVASVYGVALFDGNGTLAALWGRRGAKPDQFDAPHGISIGSDGTVFVSDTLNARVKAYSRAGVLLWTRQSKASAGTSASVDASNVIQLPSGSTIDGRGRLVLVDPFEFTIDVLDSKTGQVLAKYGDAGTQNGSFAYPTGIAYDGARDWFAVADTSNNRVQIVRLPGSGASALMPALRRTFAGNLWPCAIPLLLLLLALLFAFLAFRRRRQRRRDDETPESAPEVQT